MVPKRCSAFLGGVVRVKKKVRRAVDARDPSALRAHLRTADSARHSTLPTLCLGAAAGTTSFSVGASRGDINQCCIRTQQFREKKVRLSSSPEPFIGVVGITLQLPTTAFLPLHARFWLLTSANSKPITRTNPTQPTKHRVRQVGAFQTEPRGPHVLTPASLPMQRHPKHHVRPPAHPSALVAWAW